MPTTAAVQHTLESDSRALEELLVACLDSVAGIARANGQFTRAVRLQDAANLLRDERPSATDSTLSDREWEVAMLVARGLSNRQIAAQLIVSERTVDTHVSHILRKLSLVSRAQIAAWAVQHRRQFRLLP